MAKNGNIANFTDDDYPVQQAGEDLEESDLVGIRDDADGIRKMFKAFAGVTGGGNTQLAAIGVVLKSIPEGGYDGIWPLVRINGINTASGALASIESGDPVYLSDATPGKMTKTAPAGVGELVQLVGRAYYDKRRDPKVGDFAGAIRVDIHEAVEIEA